jgi:hypothetical protein
MPIPIADANGTPNLLIGQTIEAINGFQMSVQIIEQAAAAVDSISRRDIGAALLRLTHLTGFAVQELIRASGVSEMEREGSSFTEPDRLGGI